jgi:hypothetical protein
VSTSRSKALHSAAAGRSVAAEQRARHAIAELDRRGQPITFLAVAAEAASAPAISTATRSCAPGSSSSATSNTAPRRGRPGTPGLPGTPREREQQRAERSGKQQQGDHRDDRDHHREAAVDVARDGKIRLSPHIHNSTDDIDRTFAALDRRY